MRHRDLMPQCGTFSNTKGKQIIGIMLMKKVPSPRGAWWVGGEEVALIRWADKAIQDENNQTRLYTAVNRRVRAGATQNKVLRAIKQNPLLEIAWMAPALVRRSRRSKAK